MDYGRKIAYLRKSHNMTQEDLGKVLNVTYQAVSKWERGESLPDFETMSQIAKYFQVPLSYFEDGEEAFTQPVQREIIRETNNYVGMCTDCGKMLSENEVFRTTPKIICKSCAERRQREADSRVKAEEMRRRVERQKALGSGFDVKLLISLLFAAACYGLFMFLSVNYCKTDGGFYGALLFLIPLAVYGLVQSVAIAISDFRDTTDEFEGYKLSLSLIIAAIFAVINIICFLVLYLMTKNAFYIFMLIGGGILSFTFVSQFTWGGIIQSIFTAGGFTFKMPGFIFSLDIDSILWMIVVKLFLGIISALLFVVTTVIIALVAILGSFFTFIPSIICKTVKDKRA